MTALNLFEPGNQPENGHPCYKSVSQWVGTAGGIAQQLKYERPCNRPGLFARAYKYSRWSAGFGLRVPLGVLLWLFRPPGVAGGGVGVEVPACAGTTVTLLPVVPGGLFGFGPGRLWRVSHCRQRPGPMPDCLYQLFRLPWLGRHFEVGLSAPRVSSSLR